MLLETALFIEYQDQKTRYLKKISVITGRPLKDLNSIWNDAEHIARENGQQEKFDYIQELFKSMVGLNDSISEEMVEEKLFETDRGHGAWWVKSKKIIFIEHSDTHIRFIIDNPEMFGITREYIEAVYKKYKEHIPHEGHASEKIISKAVENNWIRIRHYRSRNNAFWDFVVNNFIRQKKYIKEFCLTMIADGLMKETDNLSITSTQDTRYYKYKTKQLLTEMDAGVLSGHTPEIMIGKPVQPDKPDAGEQGITCRQKKRKKKKTKTKIKESENIRFADYDYTLPSIQIIEK